MSMSVNSLVALSSIPLPSPEGLSLVYTVSMLVSTGSIESGSYMSVVQESVLCMFAVWSLITKGQYLVMGSHWKDSLFQLFLLESWAWPLSNDVTSVNIFLL